KKSILKLPGAFHWPKTSRIRFWAFSYSTGEPCGRSNQLITYFIASFVKEGEIPDAAHVSTQLSWKCEVDQEVRLCCHRARFVTRFKSELFGVSQAPG